MKKHIHQIAALLQTGTSRQKARSRRHASHFRPAVALLEDRCVPADLLWVGPEGDAPDFKWNTPNTDGNWVNLANNQRTNHVDTGDALYFDAGRTAGAFVGSNAQSIADVGVSVSRLDVLSAYSGTITLNEQVKVTDSGRIEGGEIGGDGLLFFSNNATQFTWSGGTINMPVSLGENPGAPLAARITGTDDKTFKKFGRIINYGTLTWTGTGNIVSAPENLFPNPQDRTFWPHVLTNESTFDILTNAGMTGPGRMDNNGTLQKRLLAGTTSVAWTFLNTGTVNISNGGTLSFAEDIRQEGGTASTTLNTGNLNARQFTIQQGTLSGVGTVSGFVLNWGVVHPGVGNLPGNLVIAGTYQQSGVGQLLIDVHQNGSIGLLSVVARPVDEGGGGFANLLGTVEVRRDLGYSGMPGTSLTFLTWVNRMGDFARPFTGNGSENIWWGALPRRRFLPVRNDRDYSLLIQSNTPPMANADNPAGNEGAPIAFNVLDNDTNPDQWDNPQTLTVTAVNGTPLTATDPDQPPSITLSTGTGGSLVVYADGRASYLPGTGSYVTDTFAYTVSDGADETDQTVTVHINRKPSLGAATLAIDENQYGYFTLPASDPNGDWLTYTLIDAPAGTSVYNMGGAWLSVTPHDGTASYPITVKATDPGGLSDTRTYTLLVADRAPVAYGESYRVRGPSLTAVPHQWPAGGLLDNDYDPGNDALTVGGVNGQTDNIGQVVTLPSGATVVVNAAGGFTYTPADDNSTTDSFTYYAYDGDLMAEATVTLTINRAPVLAALPDVTVDEGGMATLSAHAVDPNPGDWVTYSLIDPNAGGMYMMGGPPPRYSAWINSWSGDITIYGYDGPATVTLTVKATDQDGLSTTRTFTLTVNNVAPVPSWTGFYSLYSGGGNAGYVGYTIILYLGLPNDPSWADRSALLFDYDFNDDGDYDEPGETNNSTDSGFFTFATTGEHHLRGRVHDKDGGYSPEYTFTLLIYDPPA